jgi:cytochrome P450
MGTFFLAMLKYPEIQAKAQAELDRVINPGQLPTLMDQDVLPYVTAVVMEALRWKPVAPLGVPHVITTEDVYQGYSIPAGSMVMPNIWYDVNSVLSS